MAITRAQQAKQMLQDGGMLVKPGFGGKRQGYRGDAAAAAGAPGMAGPGPGADPGNGGPTGAPSQDRIAEIRQANITLENLRQDKIEEKLEKFRRLDSNQRKFQNFASKFSPVAMFASKFGPLNTRDFFTDKVLGSRNFRNMTKEQFANLTNKEQEELFDSYMEGRMSGLTDAYGNRIERGDREGINQLIPVDTTFVQTPSTMEQEPEEKDEGLRLAFRADGGPIGGEYDFESARQMYGLGKLVKKVTKTVKKIAKSPIGKAALLYAGTAGLGALGAGAARAGTGFGIFAPSNVLSNVGTSFLRFKASPIGEKIFGVGVGEDMKRTGGLLGLIKSPLGAIAGVSALAGLLTAQQEEEAQELSRGEGIDIEAARRMILQAGTSADKRGLAFRAEGGRIGYQEGSKEPVAKKTMPLLDMGGKEMDLREDGGFVPIGRMEKADDVPARLSKNEFVFTADAVRNAGDGDVDKGAEVMYNMMKNLEAGGDVSEESQGLEGARKMFQTSQRLEEVL